MKAPLKISVLVISISLFTGGLYGQTMSVGLMVGYGSFSMDDLKAYQQENLLLSDLPMKVVDEFPGYLLYRADFSLNTKKGLFEAFIGHTSTGGRIHYADYSGYSSSDLLVRMNYLGVSASTRLFKISSFDIYAGGRLLHYFSTVKIKASEQVYNSDLNNSGSASFGAMSLAIAPVIQVQRTVQRFVLKSDVSYEWHIPGNLYYEGDSDAILKSASGDNVTVDPTGIRIAVGVGYILNPGR